MELLSHFDALQFVIQKRVAHYVNKEETISVPTPCDVHYWEVVDSKGNLVQVELVQVEPPEICIQVVETRSLKAKETILGDNTLLLDGKLLKDGQRYTVRYRFWGFVDPLAFFFSSISLSTP